MSKAVPSIIPQSWQWGRQIQDLKKKKLCQQEATVNLQSTAAYKSHAASAENLFDLISPTSLILDLVADSS